MKWGLDGVVDMQEEELANELIRATHRARITVYDFYTSANPDSGDVRTFVVINENEAFPNGSERSEEVEDQIPTSARGDQDEVSEFLVSDEDSMLTGVERPEGVTNQVPTSRRRGRRSRRRSRLRRRHFPNVITIVLDSDSEQNSDTGVERPEGVTNQVPTSRRRGRRSRRRSRLRRRHFPNVITIVLDSDSEQNSDTGVERPEGVTNQVPTSRRRGRRSRRRSRLRRRHFPNVITIVLDSDSEQNSDTEGAQVVEVGEQGEEVAGDVLESAAQRGVERPEGVTNQVPTSRRRGRRSRRRSRLRRRHFPNVITIVLDSDSEQNSDTGVERPEGVTNQVPTSRRRGRRSRRRSRLRRRHFPNVITIVLDSDSEQNSDTEGVQVVEVGEQGEEVAGDVLENAAQKGVERPEGVTNQVPTSRRRGRRSRRRSRLRRRHFPNMITIVLDSDSEQNSDTEGVQVIEVGEQREEVAADVLESAAQKEGVQVMEVGEQGEEVAADVLENAAQKVQSSNQ